MWHIFSPYARTRLCLLTADGGPATSARVVDFQFSTFGPGVIDVAFFLLSALSPARLAADEATFVEHYHTALVAAGVDVADYPVDACQAEYTVAARFAALRAWPTFSWKHHISCETHFHRPAAPSLSMRTNTRPPPSSFKRTHRRTDTGSCK